MPYYIDLSLIMLDEYGKKLRDSYLPPSRQILKEKTAERFSFLIKQGIDNVAELQKLLKKKEKFEELSKAPGFSADYLTILLREMNSLHPKPNKLTEYGILSQETVSRLEKLGIKDTLKLYDKIKTKASRKLLAEQSGIPKTEIEILTAISDLSRVKWAGVAFTSMLYQLGYTSVAMVSKAEANQMHQSINQLKREKNLYKGSIGLNDIKIFIQEAGEIPAEVEGME